MHKVLAMQANPAHMRSKAHGSTGPRGVASRKTRIENVRATACPITVDPTSPPLSNRCFLVHRPRTRYVQLYNVCEVLVSQN